MSHPQGRESIVPLPRALDRDDLPAPPFTAVARRSRRRPQDQMPTLRAWPYGKHEGKDFTFAGGKQIEALLQFGKKFGLPARCSIAFNPRLDRVKQFLLAQGLGQEFNRSGFYCPHGHGNVAVTADEYDWKRDARFDQRALKFQPARPRQSDVEHDAARRIGALALKEVIC